MSNQWVVDALRDIGGVAHSSELRRTAAKRIEDLESIADGNEVVIRNAALDLKAAQARIAELEAELVAKDESIATLDAARARIAELEEALAVCGRAGCVAASELVAISPAPTEDRSGREERERGFYEYRCAAWVEKFVGTPDTRCITTPDGGCVGDGCMHDAAPPDAKAEAPNCSRCGCPKEAHRFLEIERGCEIAEARARAEAAERVLLDLVDAAVKLDCPECGGTGEIDDGEEPPPGTVWQCEECDGTGWPPELVETLRAAAALLAGK